MERKKILFMTTNLGMGGISQSLVNTANLLAKDYDVSVFCLDFVGEVKEKLNSNIKILPSNRRAKALVSNIKNAKKYGVGAFLFKFFSHIWAKVFDNRLPIYLAVKKQKHLGYFDVACSFTHEPEKHTEYGGLIRFLIDKVDSPCKTSWVHCDYTKLKPSTFNDRYYNKVDKIVGVSKSVAKAFINTHPKVKTPVEYCPNTVDYDKIYTLSEKEQEVPFSKDGIICFSVCRLSPVKAIPRAIYLFANALKESNAYWYIAGEGEDRHAIDAAIKKCDVLDRVFLIGKTDNPFPYIKNCHLYLSVSYEEAAPMVYKEAKALFTPIFSTETLSSLEMLDKDVDFICKNNDEDMEKTFRIAVGDKEQLERRRKRAKSYTGSNAEVINTFKKWLGEKVDV